MGISDFKYRYKASDFDKVYLIVRSVSSLEKRKDEILNFAEILPVLSPGQDLFHKYLGWSKSGEWNTETFEKLYRPAFLSQISADTEALSWLQYFSKVSAVKNIALLCFCKDKDTCHRKIVGELIQARTGIVSIK